MKILHTSDWHLRKIVHGVHMSPEQAQVLEQLIQDLEKHEIDVLIIAGDIYDRSVPPVEAVEPFNRTITWIVRDTSVKKILIISGNHDSPHRLDFGASLFDMLEVHIAGKYDEHVPAITLEDQWGPVTFHLLPFKISGNVRALLSDPDIQDFDGVVAGQLARTVASLEAGQQHVCVAHHYVAGAENIRYSGSSLMKYSFSELDGKNGGLLVTIEGEGNIRVDQLEWEPQRQLSQMTGSLEMLLSPS